MWDSLWGIGGPSSVEFVLPPNYYVIAQCELNLIINTTGSSTISIVSYTLPDDTVVNLEYPNQPPTVWGQGILNVTFLIDPFGSFTTGLANVFLW